MNLPRLASDPGGLLEPDWPFVGSILTFRKKKVESLTAPDEDLSVRPCTY